MVVILRANQIYSQPSKPGRLPTGKSHFYEEIEPKLEKVVLGPKAVGYTERSLDKMIEEGSTRPPPSVIADCARTPTSAPPKPPQPKHAEKHLRRPGAELN